MSDEVVGIDINTTAGSKLFISADLPDALDDEGFEGVSGWEKIARITDLGSLEQAFTPVEFNDVEMRDTYTLKGTRTPVELTIEIGRVADDAGQNLVLTALESDNDYSFKIEIQDGTTFGFVGKVLSANLNLGDANAITGRSVTIRLNSRLIEIEAGS